MDRKRAKPREESSLFVDPEDIVKDLLNLQTDVRAILFMPEDLSDLYKESLASRMKSFGINLVIANPDKSHDALGSFDRVLTYHCSLPASDSESVQNPNDHQEESSNKMGLFDIKGAPSEIAMTPFPREAGFLTELEKRYLLLKETVQVQEKNEHFINLASIQQKIRLKLLTVNERQMEADRLSIKIREVDEGYYTIMEYFLKEAIDSVLQLVTLGDIMKRYIKILIIDDLGERSAEQLEKMGFRKRLLSNMSQHTFTQLYNEFRQKFQEQHPNKVITYFDFFTRCSVFDEHQIVLFNPWKCEKGELPVQFALKKAPELSKKEIRKKNEDTAIVALKVDTLMKNHRKLILELDTAESKIKSAETTGNLGESAYVALNKKRKRILRNLNKVSEELKEVQKEITGESELMHYNRDFFLAFKDRKTAKLIMAQKKLKPDDFQAMVDLMQQKKAKNHQTRQLKTKIKSMLNTIQETVNHHPIDPEKSYQQVLGIHTLNKLEMTVLGSGIAKVNYLVHICRRPYFQECGEKSSVNWNNDKLSQVSIYLNSKNIPVNTSLLQNFFRIDSWDISERIENSPTLPSANEFNNEKFALFIINYDSYPFQEIVNCLKTRNRSKRSFVPVLILDPMHKITAKRQKTMFNLLIGLKRETNKTLSLNAPPYCVNSLDNPATLCPILCEVIGINEDTVPSFVENEDHDLEIRGEKFSDKQHVTRKSEHSDIASMDQDTGMPNESAMSIATEIKNDKIQLALLDEDPEEIYTLGSLFSFDDNTQSATSENIEKAIPPKRVDDTAVGSKQVVSEDDTPKSQHIYKTVDSDKIEPKTQELPKEDDETLKSNHLF